MQDVVRNAVIDLLGAVVRDAGHHRERLVRVRQARIKIEQVLGRGNAVELSAHD